MNISARNSFAGTITAIGNGPVSTEVTIKIAPCAFSRSSDRFSVSRGDTDQIAASESSKSPHWLNAGRDLGAGAERDS